MSRTLTARCPNRNTDILPRRNQCFSLALILLVLTVHLRLTRANAAEQPQSHSVFPEYLWTYREQDGLDPPQPGIVFLVIRNVDVPSERQLIVVNENVEPGTVVKILNARGARHNPICLYEGGAPPRQIAFNRMDLDNDKIDEVLVTGRGGAGGTSWLIVFKVTKDQVRKVFEDTSRHGFWLFDENNARNYAIANPGFESLQNDDHLLPVHFALYHLRNGKYEKYDRFSSQTFESVTSKLNPRIGFPLSDNLLRVYDGKPYAPQKSSSISEERRP